MNNVVARRMTAEFLGTFWLVLRAEDGVVSPEHSPQRRPVSCRVGPLPSHLH